MFSTLAKSSYGGAFRYSVEDKFGLKLREIKYPPRPSSLDPDRTGYRGYLEGNETFYHSNQIFASGLEINMRLVVEHDPNVCCRYVFTFILIILSQAKICDRDYKDKHLKPGATCIIGGLINDRSVHHHEFANLLEHKIVIVEHQAKGFGDNIWVVSLPGAKEAGLGFPVKMISGQYLKVC